MPLDYEKIRSLRIPPVTQRYDERDTILYALGVGFGHDPLDADQLRYVTEEELVPVPTMASVLGHPGSWMSDPATGITWRQVVHGEQRLRLHAPLASRGEVVGHTRITAVVDKGDKVGAIVCQQTTVSDRHSGELLATVEQASVCRGDGGFGGGDAAPDPLPMPPNREPDAQCDLPTLPQAALIYRLSGDRNPLHVNPETAAAAGFPRPILHGLCTYGMAAHAVLRTWCSYQAAKLVGLSVRFSAPVYPGETIRIAMWSGTSTDGVDTIHFQARTNERDVIVLDRGVASVRSLATMRAGG